MRSLLLRDLIHEPGLTRWSFASCPEYECNAATIPPRRHGQPEMISWLAILTAHLVEPPLRIIKVALRRHRVARIDDLQHEWATPPEHAHVGILPACAVATSARSHGKRAMRRNLAATSDTD